MTEIEKEKIIKMVLAELAAGKQSRTPPKKKVLTIFSGGVIGLDVVLKEMQRLQQEGYGFAAVFTPNGKTVIGQQRLQDFLGSIPIYDDSRDFNKLIELMTDSEAILIPVLTMNTAAKVVNGIADNLATTAIMIALLTGKPVIGVRDACDLKHLSRVEMGHNQAVQAYKAMLMSNVGRLKEFGIKLCEAAALAEVLPAYLGAQGLVNPVETKEIPGVFSQRVFSVADIPKEVEKISLSPQTIITPAAKDAIKERGIEVIIC